MKFVFRVVQLLKMGRCDKEVYFRAYEHTEVNRYDKALYICTGYAVTARGRFMLG